MEKQEPTKEQVEKIAGLMGCLIWILILIFGSLLYLLALQCVKQTIKVINPAPPVEELLAEPLSQQSSPIP